MAAHQTRINAAHRARETERARERAKAATRAAEIWKAATPAQGDHKYLVRKRVRTHGLRLYRGSLVVKGMPCDGSLIVPACDGSDAIHTLQFIHPEKRDGDNHEKRRCDNKRFLPGGDYRGRYFNIGTMEGNSTLCLCEGYATGASIHEATGNPVAVAFNAGNLLPVAQSLRARFPNSRLILCADDDTAIDGNPGRTKAIEAARAVGGGLVAVPDFGPDRPEGATDFNDLRQHRGPEAVAECIRRQVEIAAVHRLAELSPMDYDRIRQVEADALGVRVTTLDAEVEKFRRTLNAGGAQQGSEGSGEVVLFPEVEPWPEPVDGAELLTDAAGMYRRHVVLPEHAPVALALWTLFTHAIPAVNVAPILALTSPVKRCGKSTVLALLRRLARRPLPSANISASALFRAVEAWEPTLLIDEADTFIRSNEELRGILNSGHTRDLAFVIRNVAVGDDHEPRRFSTWGAKAIALIGKLPDTLADRSIEVRLKRKLPGESVKKVRHADPELFHALARRCSRWAADYIHQIRAARPSMPKALNDRAQDSWEPLLAIAALAGGRWLEKACTAAVKLSGAVDAANDTLGVQLLSDIRAVLKDFQGSDRISGEDLTARLLALEDRPWPECSRGKPLTKTKLARLLRPFGVVSGSRRLPDGTTPKGYLLDQFPDAFERYLPPPEDTLLKRNTATT